MKNGHISRKAVIQFCLCLIVLAPVVACSNDGLLQQTSDGWETAGLADVGIDEKIIGEVIERIRDGTYQNVHSILIVKDGKLVFEEYFGGHAFDYSGDQFHGEYVEYGIDTLHNLASVTKSFTSALLGIAIERGYIQDEREEVFAFLYCPR
jgi:CubicO group peptidase (beta-lactamase class C family)